MSEKFDDIEMEGDLEIPTSAKVKTDIPTPEEVQQMPDEEVIGNVERFADDETKSLYAEFSGILAVEENVKTENVVKQVIPTGIKLLDATLGGGFAVGALSVVVGNPGSGKSMLAMQAAGRAQLKFKNSIVMFLDSEESTTTQRLSDLGVRYPEIVPYGEMTVEKVFRIIEKLCIFKNEKNMIDIPSVVIWDSIANTLSEKEMTITDPNQAIGYKARVLTQLLPQYISKCSKYGIALVAVNQLRDVIAMGPYSAPRDLKMMSSHKDMPGGNSLKFNAFQLVEMKPKSVLDESKFGFDGIMARCKCAKNKLFRPNIEVDIIGNFTHGFSNFWSSYNFLVDTKRLQSGAWNKLVNCPEIKFRTKDALEKYRTDKIFRTAFDKEVDDAIKVEITDKYSTIISDVIE